MRPISDLEKTLQSRRAFVQASLRPLLFSLALFIVAPASAQLAIPLSATVGFPNVFVTASYTMDLGGLPGRPTVVVEASAGPGNETAVLEVQFTNPQIAGDPGGQCPGIIQNSDPVPGPNSARYLIYRCHPDPTKFIGDTVVVLVRVADFGGLSAPLDVDIEIRAETTVITGELLEPYAPTFAQQTVRLSPSKDTTIYQESMLGSNGRHSSLWAGSDLTFQGGVFSFDAIRSLIAFDIAGPIPSSAQIDSATLELDVLEVRGANNVLSIHAVAPDAGAPAVIWAEGDADSGGDGFTAGFSSIPAANWLDRESPTVPWAVMGGDFGPTLLSTPVTVTGIRSFSSPELEDEVAYMAATGEDENGFLLSGSTGFGDIGIRFRSSEAFSTTPSLEVLFTPTEPYQEGQGTTTALPFIGEGENLRWIYDADADDIFQTHIGGICTVNDPDHQGFQLPYSYQYTGTPGYTGLDCCTWQINSVSSGTVGTGQAIFFHNLDPTQPANIPPDTDGDGMRDNCDNCVWTPNGPFLGTCLSGPNIDDVCHSDLECGGHLCSLGQEDTDRNFVGDACPEPGFGMTLWVGVMLLSHLSPIRRKRFP